TETGPTNGLAVFGNVGIGTTSPNAKLEVAGAAIVNGALTTTGNFVANGNSSVLGAGSFGYAATVTAPANGLAVFGNVGIGTTSASSKLTIRDLTTTSGTVASIQSPTLTTGKLLDLNLNSYNTLTTGTILNVGATATTLTGTAGTGSLANFDWSPTGSTTATGDLVAINIGTNGTTTGNLFNILDSGSSIFSVSETALTSSLPVNFTSPGDVSIAYDLQFTNPTASYIKSAAPLYIAAGDLAGSSNLTLQTFNNGQGVFDFAGGVTLNQNQNWNLANYTNALMFLSSTGTTTLALD